MKKEIVIVSDNHTNYDFEVPAPKEDVPSVLIHCGDFSYQGKPDEMIDFRDWLARQPHTHKLFIWGNHEKIEQQELYWREYLEEVDGVKCLHNTEYTIDGLKFFGSSFTPTFGRWAFLKDDDQRKRYWEIAPDDVDVLVTHGPPFGLLDTVDGLEIEPGKLEHLGCIHLRKYIERVKPKLACWGHIHCSGGNVMPLKHWDNTPDTMCVNASVLNEGYELVRQPIVIEV